MKETKQNPSVLYSFSTASLWHSSSVIVRMQVPEIHKVAYCFTCLKKNNRLSSSSYSVIYFGKRKHTAL